MSKLTIKLLDDLELLRTGEGVDNHTMFGRLLEEHEAELIALARQALEDRWVPVSERLPGESGDYLVTRSSDTGNPNKPQYTVDQLYWRWSHSHWGDILKPTQGVIAWRPLPKPYTPPTE